jgi:hypothetical protein
MPLPSATGFDWKDERTGTAPNKLDMLCCETDQYPPKADEQIAHSRYLARMGKNCHLCALCASVVNTCCRHISLAFLRVPC